MEKLGQTHEACPGGIGGGKGWEGSFAALRLPAQRDPLERSGVAARARQHGRPPRFFFFMCCLWFVGTSKPAGLVGWDCRNSPRAGQKGTEYPSPTTSMGEWGLGAGIQQFIIQTPTLQRDFSGKRLRASPRCWQAGDKGVGGGTAGFGPVGP